MQYREDTGSLAWFRRRETLLWLVAALVIIVVDFWGSRYDLNPDGISYVEMAKHTVETGPAALINGYWSPGYPSLLLPIHTLAGHAPFEALIPFLHITNLLLMIAALFAFIALLGKIATPEFGVGAVSTRAGAAIFLVIAVQCIGLGLLTPDVGVMLILLLIALATIAFYRDPTWRGAVLLGAAMGAGYWMKAILLPMSVLLLATLFALPPRPKGSRARLVAAVAMLGVVALPLIVMVSLHVQRITMGEVGRLNYGWEINGVTPFVGWLGDSTTAFGVPLHPPRVLQASPQTLEFKTPIGGTYPLWYEPSYWYAGLRPRFEFDGQLRALGRGVHAVASMLHVTWVLWAGLIALWFASVRRPQAGVWARAPIVLGLWSVEGVALYSMVHVEPRYLAGFLATGAAAVWALVASRTPRRAMRWVMPLFLLACVASTARFLEQNIGGFEPAYRPQYLLDAAALRAHGIQPGDPVAVVGDAFEAYATFSGGTPVRAQVMDSAGYWTTTPVARHALGYRLAETGVKALLANNVDPAFTGEGWVLFRRDDDSNLGLLLLQKP